MDTIITIGLSPCWDVTCQGAALNWGRHCKIDRQLSQPAGKALNVSRALAWLGQRTTAVGLWGSLDYAQMREKLKSFRSLIKINMTCVPGQTRLNVTVVDTKNRRELHLRAPGTLASTSALNQLRNDLSKIIRKNTICVFSGSFPNGKFLNNALSLIKTCRDHRAKIVVDTSGEPLKAIMDLGGIWLVKPNVAELNDLLGQTIKDSPAILARAAAKLLNRAQIILISRGLRGALVVTKKVVLLGRVTSRRRPMFSTVGCGDYLLAGFLYGLSHGRNPSAALGSALETATARAWDLTEKLNWTQVHGSIPVKIQPVSL